MRTRRPEPDVLSSLLEVSHILASSAELDASLHRVLERLERHHAVDQAAVSLIEREGEEINIRASIGVTAEGRRARYKIGEGLTGRVIHSGKPVVVPELSREPLFLNRAFGRKKGGAEHSFICVPIGIGKKPGGALAVNLPYDAARDYDSAARFFGVVASMIGLALAGQRRLEDDRRRLLEENSSLRLELTERYEVSNIVGTAGPMRVLHEQIAQVARTNTTVLIRGESGTGKELIAHAIHYNSPRAKKSFVKLSCAALPSTLIESELFGHERGAFTGAFARKKGRFEAADGGTLLLDEIGDVDLATQVKLLRVLQEREIERVGSTQTIKVNVRLIAATNKDLEAAIGEKTFREDLYHRLNVFSIFVPPLRERKPDIMLLADHFLTKYSRQHGKSIKRISTPAIDMLSSYHWPGNVRELENIIERAVLVSDGQVIHGHHLPPTLQTAEASGTGASTPLAEAVEQFEKDLILDALKSSRGNRAKAARVLQSTERILGYKVRQYRIDCSRFRR